LAGSLTVPPSCRRAPRTRSRNPASSAGSTDAVPAAASAVRTCWANAKCGGQRWQVARWPSTSSREVGPRWRKSPYHTVRPPARQLAPLGAATARADAKRALALVGLPVREFGSRFPHELSRGQRQRVAHARAVAGTARLLLLDEPFGALDAISRAELQEVLASVRAALATTIVLVTHDLAEAARHADSIAVMRDGRVEQCGAVAARSR
jgi:ABC-type dipeptide/oligopeptide/nickel transport system ATPase component